MGSIRPLSNNQSSILLAALPLAAISLCFANQAHAQRECCLPTFYVGADAQVRITRFYKNYGGNFYKKEYPQANIYLGVKGNEYFGIESGTEVSTTRTHSAYIPVGSYVLGAPEEIDASIKTVVRFRTLHTSLIGIFPICEDSGFNILFAVGATNLKVRLENTLTQLGSTQVEKRLKLAQSRTVLRLMTGVQYMFNDCFGVRANVRWENTKQLKNIEPVRSMAPHIARIKDSFTYGLGFVIQF